MLIYVLVRREPVYVCLSARHFPIEKEYSVRIEFARSASKFLT